MAKIKNFVTAFTIVKKYQIELLQMKRVMSDLRKSQTRHYRRTTVNLRHKNRNYANAV